MKKLILLLTFGLVLSCSNIQHPDFAANVESAKKLLELQGTEARSKSNYMKPLF